jgi:hypothetical protein
MYMKITEWEHGESAVAISQAGLNQLERRINTFPTLWQKISSKVNPVN